MASPEEGGGNAEDHRASLVTRVPAVVHISYNPAVRGDYGACSGGGDTQEEHHLAAQELSYTGAQDLTSVSLSMEHRKDIEKNNVPDYTDSNIGRLTIFNILIRIILYLI